MYLSCQVFNASLTDTASIPSKVYDKNSTTLRPKRKIHLLSDKHNLKYKLLLLAISHCHQIPHQLSQQINA